MRKAAIGIVASLLMGGCSKVHSSGRIQAPDFSLQDLSGKKVSLSQFRGHPVLLDFWATWCGPCLAAAPTVDAFYERHIKDGLVVLGLNMDDDPSPVYAYTKKVGIPYPVLLAGSSSLASDYGINGFPSFVLIDGEGRAVQMYEGFAPEMADAWESELQNLLAKAH